MRRTKHLAMVAAASAMGWMGCSSHVQQSEDCQALVACARAKDRSAGTTTDVSRYEAEGACWENEGIAELCERSCTRGMAFIRSREPSAPSECLP